MALSKPSAQQIALACGVAGAYVEVTDDLITDTISGSWGKTSSFSDTRPGIFSFDLVNDTGKYTPGNASSTLSTAVRVGMGVSHIVDGMHFSGTIRSARPYFTGPAGQAGSAKVNITCDDMLGEASRTDLSETLSRSMVLGSTPYLYWPLNESANAPQAMEISGAQQLSLGPVGGSTIPTFGVAGFSALDGDTQLQSPLTAVAGQMFMGTGAFSSTGGAAVSAPGQISTFDYSANSMGTWGAWFTPVEALSNLEILIRPNGYNTTASSSIRFGINSSQQLFLKMGASSSVVSSTSLVLGAPHYLSVTVTYSGSSSISGELFVDGVSQGSVAYVPGGGDPPGLSTNYLRTPMWVVLISNITGSVPGAVNLSHLSHTATAVSEYLLPASTEAVALTVLDQSSSNLTFDTLPAGLSTALIAANPTSGSVLSAINDVIRTEQGYMWVETTGTLTAPIPKVKVRARDRGATVDAARTFDISEIQNAPEFTTDLENMASTVTARGPSRSATVTDATLIPYVGSATDSSNVLLVNAIDLTAWAQDRLLRGVNTGVRLPQFTVDALRINRWADVSALRAGDRVRITGLPSAQLGVTYLDGWLLGCGYSLMYPSLHSEDQMIFTFSMQPVLADTAIYDTNRYMAGGSITIFTNISSSATSVQLATFPSTGPLMETTDVPYSLLLDSEQVTLTACTSPTTSVVTNLIVNPSGAVDTTGYTEIPGTAGATLAPRPMNSVDSGYTGTVVNVAWVTGSTAAGGGVYYTQTVSASTVYSFAVNHVLSSINNRLNIIVDWYNGAAFISSSTGTETQVTANTSYTTFTLANKTSPATATTARIKVISVAGTGYANWSSGSFVEVGQLMCNTGAAVLPYFDGNTADTPGLTYAFTGLPNASTSTFTTAYQTATITRAQASTTAAAHTTTSTVEVTPASLYAF